MIILKVHLVCNNIWKICWKNIVNSSGILLPIHSEWCLNQTFLDLTPLSNNIIQWTSSSSFVFAPLPWKRQQRALPSARENKEIFCDGADAVSRTQHLTNAVLPLINMHSNIASNILYDIYKSNSWIFLALFLGISPSVRRPLSLVSTGGSSIAFLK